jgi:hypothetical protein
MSDTMKIVHFGCQRAENGYAVTVGFQSNDDPEDIRSQLWLFMDAVSLRAAFEQWIVDANR